MQRGELKEQVINILTFSLVKLFILSLNNWGQPKQNKTKASAKLAIAMSQKEGHIFVTKSSQKVRPLFPSPASPTSLCYHSLEYFISSTCSRLGHRRIPVPSRAKWAREDRANMFLLLQGQGLEGPTHGFHCHCSG